MQDNVDYRLLERFEAKQQANQQPTAQKHAATATTGQRLPSIGLRD